VNKNVKHAQTRHQGNQIPNITLCIQYVFFVYYAVGPYNWVWDKVPEAGEFSRIFLLKVILQSVSYRKKCGIKMY